MRKTTSLVLFLCLIIALLAVGCGGGDGDSPTNPAPSMDLSAVDLGVQSSPPMGRIYVSGLPANKVAYEVVVLAAAGLDAFTLPLETPEEGLPWFAAPFHPAQPNSGGVIEVQVVGGTARSPKLSLELGALPEAPGRFAQYVASLREHIDQRARREGSSFDALYDQDIADVPSRLLPLKFAQSAVDDQNSPNCLARIAERTSTYLDADKLDLLDRMFGFANIDSVVRADIDHMTGLTDPDLVWPDTQSLNKACITVGPATINAAQLSDGMQKAWAAKIATDPNGAPGKILAATGLALGAAAFVPGLAPVAAVAGAGLWAYQTAREFTANTYPSSFVTLDFQLEDEVFTEDFDGLSHWTDVMVTAKSNGWIADKAIFNGVMQLVGYGLGKVGANTIANSEQLGAAALTDVTMSVGFYLDDQPSGVVELCPQQWQVDITGLPYSRGEAVIGRVSTSDFQEIRPLMIGADVIRVSAAKEAFGYLTVHAEKTVETRQIQVTAVPSSIVVHTPGEIVNITATLTDAEIQTLNWVTEKGSWNDGSGTATNTPGTRPLLTPPSPADYPFLVTVESLSRQGLRSEGTPPRQDIVTVSYQTGFITVSPGYACVANGESETYTADVQGLDNTAVTWSLVPVAGGGSVIGSISNTGVYSAPAGGTAKMLVVATSQEVAAIQGQAELDVGACTCNFELVIDAAGVWSGDYAAHFWATDFTPFTLAFEVRDGASEQIGTIQIFQGDKPGPGQTGSYDCIFGWGTPGGTWVATNTEGTSATLEVSKNTEAMMQATVTGVAMSPVNGQALLRSFHMTIRSGNAASDGALCGE